MPNTTLESQSEYPKAIETDEDKLIYDEVDDDLNVVDESESEFQKPTRFRITSYGADLSVFDLRRRLGNEILIPAPFQRKYVWTQRQASRFIESILLGLPVPGIFVYLKDKKQLIVDGQQRLITLDRFLSGIWEIRTRRQGNREVQVSQPFTLVDVDPSWEGKTINELGADDKDEIENYLIHATIFRQDHPREKDRSIYEVFERINTGGLRLSPQEIRACINHGNLVLWLGHAAELESWRRIYGKRSPRLKDEELILRFFALFSLYNNYKRPMRVFLDEYMEDHRDKPADQLVALQSLLIRTLDTFWRSIGERVFRPEKALNAAVFDAMMVGCATRVSAGDITDVNSVRTAYESLLSDDNFRRYYERATADEESVKNRINLAITAFASLD